MVDIQEESSTVHGDRGAGGDPSSSQSGSADTSGGVPSGGVMEFLKSKGLDTLLWILRLTTVVFTILYILPIGVNQYSCYQKALLAGAATYALRLQQRMGTFRLSREFLAQLFLEDACHYLFFCLLFATSKPLTMALVPVSLFAFLHSASFTIQLFNVAGQPAALAFLRRWLSQALEMQQQILLMIACAEIFLFPACIMMLFAGQAGGLLVPFLYYRFLTLRYASRRNPNSRLAFSQLRMSVEGLAQQPRCPGFVRNALHTGVAFVSRLAPTYAAAS